MKRSILPLAVVLTVGWLCLADSADAGQRKLLRGNARNQSPCYPWHGQYYNAQWGMPLALVVPPTAEKQTNWSWGVGGTRIDPIRHQFAPAYSGPGPYNPSGFRPMPPQPSDTRQMGVYYIRGPW
ncbi:MAG: hypothetical protein HQ581_24400 [Planctomycetes bacterium]|nr:hypothetical protein [Planctomycetota bacterium]